PPGPADTLVQPGAERAAQDLTQAQGPEVVVEHQPLVIQRVLGEGPVVVDQRPAEVFEHAAAGPGPTARGGERGEEGPDRPEPDPFGDPVVVPLAQGVTERRLDPTPRDGDHLRERGDPPGRGGG